MNHYSHDVVLLTQREYLNPHAINSYTQNILTEDKLLTCALEKKGLRVTRTSWDNETFDWASTRFALFRATWDYFHRFSEFQLWLNKRANDIQLINPYSVIQWNMNKQYLGVLQSRGVNIPPTLFLEKGSSVNLRDILLQTGWHQAILKPAVAGGARHTYLLNLTNVDKVEMIFQHLISSEMMLLQQFQERITIMGEVSLMLFGGQYSHAVLKKTRPGDFRVQDDFGGTVHSYTASKEEKNFVHHVMSQCNELPVYARVDLMWDNHNQLCLSELEMIEPELWLRNYPQSADMMADAVEQYINQ